MASVTRELQPQASQLVILQGEPEVRDQLVQSHRWIGIGYGGGEVALKCACGLWSPFAESCEIAWRRECEQLELERASAARSALISHER